VTEQHTPGPWHVEDDQTIWAGHKLVAGAARRDVPMAANARLIAEAPSTLAALEHLLGTMEPPRSRKASEAWDAAHAAVRRARTATD
jgi:hypothetical protein